MGIREFVHTWKQRRAASKITGGKVTRSNVATAIEKFKFNETVQTPWLKDAFLYAGKQSNKFDILKQITKKDNLEQAASEAADLFINKKILGKNYEIQKAFEQALDEIGQNADNLFEKNKYSFYDFFVKKMSGQLVDILNERNKEYQEAVNQNLSIKYIPKETLERVGAQAQEEALNSFNNYLEERKGKINHGFPDKATEIQEKLASVKEKMQEMKWTNLQSAQNVSLDKMNDLISKVKELKNSIFESHGDLLQKYDIGSGREYAVDPDALNEFMNKLNNMSWLLENAYSTSKLALDVIKGENVENKQKRNEKSIIREINNSLNEISRKNEIIENIEGASEIIDIGKKIKSMSNKLSLSQSVDERKRAIENLRKDMEKLNEVMNEVREQVPDAEDAKKSDMLEFVKLADDVQINLNRFIGNAMVQRKEEVPKPETTKQFVYYLDGDKISMDTGNHVSIDIANAALTGLATTARNTKRNIKEAKKFFKKLSEQADQKAWLKANYFATMIQDRYDEFVNEKGILPVANIAFLSELSKTMKTEEKQEVEKIIETIKGNKNNIDDAILENIKNMKFTIAINQLVKKIEEKVDIFAQDVLNARNELDEKEEELEQLKLTKGVDPKIIQQKDQEIAKLKQEIQNKQGIVDNITQLNQNLAQQQNDLKNKITNLEQELNQGKIKNQQEIKLKQQELDGAKNQLKIYQNQEIEFNKAKQALVQKDEEIKQLKEVGGNEKLIEEKEKEIEEQLKEITKLNEQNLQLQKEVEEKDKLNKQIQANSEKLLQKILGLQTELKEANKKLESPDADKNELNKQITNLTQQVQELTKAKDELENVREALKQAEIERSDALKLIEEKREEIENQKIESNKKIEELNNKLTELPKEKDKEITKLTKEIEQLKIKAEGKAELKELEKLQKEIELRDNKIAGYIKQVSKIEENYKEKYKQESEKLKQKEEELNKKSEELVKLNDELQQNRVKLNEAAKILEISKSEMQEKQKQLEKMEQELGSKKDDEKEKLQNKIEILSNEINGYKEEQVAYVEEINNLKYTVGNLNEQIEEQKQSITAEYNKQIIALQQELGENKNNGAKVEELNNEITQLKEQLKLLGTAKTVEVPKIKIKLIKAEAEKEDYEINLTNVLQEIGFSDVEIFDNVDYLNNIFIDSDRKNGKKKIMEYAIKLGVEGINEVDYWGDTGQMTRKSGRGSDYGFYDALYILTKLSEKFDKYKSKIDELFKNILEIMYYTVKYGTLQPLELIDISDSVNRLNIAEINQHIVKLTKKIAQKCDKIDKYAEKLKKVMISEQNIPINLPDALIIDKPNFESILANLINTIQSDTESQKWIIEGPFGDGKNHRLREDMQKIINGASFMYKNTWGLSGVSPTKYDDKNLKYEDISEKAIMFYLLKKTNKKGYLYETKYESGNLNVQLIKSIMDDPKQTQMFTDIAASKYSNKNRVDMILGNIKIGLTNELPIMCYLKINSINYPAYIVGTEQENTSLIIPYTIDKNIFDGLGSVEEIKLGSKKILKITGNLDNILQKIENMKIFQIV